FILAVGTIEPRKNLKTLVRAFAEVLGAGGAARRGAVARWRILELLRERLLARALDTEGVAGRLDALAAEVASKQRDPYSAVEEILQSMNGGGAAKM
ncbi:MAG: hypothetical protein ACRD68_09975, partial [Pyrinomonadaceae bacterium]